MSKKASIGIVYTYHFLLLAEIHMQFVIVDLSGC